MDTNLFEQIGNSSSKIYFIYDIKAGGFAYLNKAIEQVFLGEQHVFLKDPGILFNAVHPDDRDLVSDHYGNLLQGTPGEIKFRLQFPGEQVKVMLAEAFPIHDNEGNLALLAGHAEDITDRVAYISYLMEFGKKKNAALEILSHDLRGPLAMVQSVAELLEKDHAEQNYSEISTYTGFIGQACKNCISLITELLSEEHLKAPTIVVNTERVNLVNKVKELVDFYRLNKAVRQEIAIHATLPAYVLADIVKLDQILNNLISNSIKFTPPDGLITITITQEGAHVLLKINDNGIGIPRELMPFLFEKYSRASRAGLQGEKTTGIGLFIVRELVELQGGAIWCESPEGGGTTFVIRLPAA